MSENKIYISWVPADFEFLLKLYVENERIGGGHYQSFIYDADKQVVTVDFDEEATARHFIEMKEIEILRHKMPVIPVPNEATIFVYEVDEVIREDIDCNLESSRKGGGRLVELKYHDMFLCAEAIFEKDEIAQNLISKGHIEILKKQFPISNLPPYIYLPQNRFKTVNRIILSENKPFDYSKNNSKTTTRSNSVPLEDDKKVGPYGDKFDEKDANYDENEDENDKKKSEDDEDSDESNSDDDHEESVTFEAFNLSEKLDEKKLKLLLTNKRHGGPLKSFKFDTRNKTATFSFQDIALTKDFAQKDKITMTKDVYFQIRKIPTFTRRKRSSSSSSSSSSTTTTPPPSTLPTPPVPSSSSSSSLKGQGSTIKGTVEVVGNITKYKLEMYAPNKNRSKGGPIENVVELSENSYLVVFENLKDAISFNNHNHFEFLKTVITTTLLDSWPANIKPRAIKVQGYKTDTKPETLKMFFENARSGGSSGSVTEVVILAPDVAIVTFNNADVVKNILLKPTLKLSEKELKVEVMQPARPPSMIVDGSDTDPNMLVFSNLKHKHFKVDIFKKFISDLAKAEVTNIEFNNSCDKVLVIFKSEPNYQNLLDTLCCTPFQGYMISMDRVGLISSIAVKKDPAFDVEFLKMYLENKKRSGGGTVKSVTEADGGDFYIVEFENHENVAKVLGKEGGHTLKNVPLSIIPHIKNFN